MKHNPADISELVATLGCTERHARRLLSEHGKETALGLRAALAEKLRLQITLLELTIERLASGHIHRDIVKAERLTVCAAVEKGLRALVARLLRELPGHTAGQMGEIIRVAVNDSLREMSREMTA